MNVTVRDVMMAHVKGVVAVRGRLSYPPGPRHVPRTYMNLDF